MNVAVIFSALSVCLASNLIVISLLSCRTLLDTSVTMFMPSSFVVT
jgi:hypothetical protein